MGKSGEVGNFASAATLIPRRVTSRFCGSRKVWPSIRRRSEVMEGKISWSRDATGLINDRSSEGLERVVRVERKILISNLGRLSYRLSNGCPMMMMIYFTPVVGIWRLPRVQHIAPSTGHLSYRPEAFLSMVQ